MPPLRRLWGTIAGMKKPAAPAAALTRGPALRPSFALAEPLVAGQGADPYAACCDWPALRQVWQARR